MDRSDVVKLIVFYHFMHVLTDGTVLRETEIKCFNTVTHYFSNPDVSGSPRLAYTYNNEDFQTINFSLNCDIFMNVTGIIEVQYVLLLLPADEKDFCIHSNESNHLNCSSDLQCSCCTLPNITCNKTLHNMYDSCNNYQNCKLPVKSEFLENCTGRTYACENKNCHSRWAQVIYTCQQQDVGSTTQPPRLPPTNHGGTTQSTKHKLVIRSTTVAQFSTKENKISDDNYQAEPSVKTVVEEVPRESLGLSVGDVVIIPILLVTLIVSVTSACLLVFLCNGLKSKGGKENSVGRDDEYTQRQPLQSTSSSSSGEEETPV